MAGEGGGTGAPAGEGRGDDGPELNRAQRLLVPLCVWLLTVNLVVGALNGWLPFTGGGGGGPAARPGPGIAGTGVALAPPTPAPSPTAVPSPTPQPTPRPSPTASATAAPSPTASATPSPTASPTAAPTATPEPTATPAPEPTPTAEPEPTPAPAPPPPPPAPPPPPPRAPPTPTRTPTRTPTPAFPATHRLIAPRPVNLRAGPGPGYPALGTVQPGALLATTGEAAPAGGDTWRRFRLADGRAGWVREIDVAPVR